MINLQTRPYDNPAPGIYCSEIEIEMDGNIGILALALGYGWSDPEAAKVVMSEAEDEEQVDRLAIAATQFLNSLETRPGFRWGPDNSEEKFGLFDAREPSTQEIYAPPPEATTSTPSAKENTTKEGIEVKPGQIWIDLDRRMNGRSVFVETVKDGRAHCRTAAGKKTRIAIRRMHKGSTGWKLKP